MYKTIRVPLIILVSVTLAVGAGACTRQITSPTVTIPSPIPTLAVLMESTATRAASPSAPAQTETMPVFATDALPKSAEAASTATPEPTTSGQKEAETPLAFTPTATDYVVNPNITPSVVAAENATFLGKHVVQNYDSLDSIARAYGVDPEAIVQSNTLTNRMVTAGQTLTIPAVKWVNVTAGPISIPQFPPMYQNAGFSK